MLGDRIWNTGMRLVVTTCMGPLRNNTNMAVQLFSWAVNEDKLTYILRYWDFCLLMNGLSLSGCHASVFRQTTKQQYELPANTWTVTDEWHTASFRAKLFKYFFHSWWNILQSSESWAGLFLENVNWEWLDLALGPRKNYHVLQKLRFFSKYRFCTYFNSKSHFIYLLLHLFCSRQVET